MTKSVTRTRVTYANVMATIAVFIALSGSSYAALKVTSRNVPKDALTGADIKNLTGKDVRNNSLTGADLKDLTSADVANGRLLAEDTDPCALPAPATLVLCGTSANHWDNGGFGVPGLQVWRDRVGQVHIRGSAKISTSLGTNSHPTLFVLPPAQRPKRLLGLPIMTGQSAGLHAPNAALLLVYPEGLVAVFTDTTDEVVHLGDIAFRTDA